MFIQNRDAVLCRRRGKKPGAFSLKDSPPLLGHAKTSVRFLLTWTVFLPYDM
jgi:hypothetical protein